MSVSYDDDDDGNDDDITCGFAEIGDCGHKNDDRWRKWSKLDFWNIIASSQKKILILWKGKHSATSQLQEPVAIRQKKISIKKTKVVLEFLDGAILQGGGQTKCHKNSF